MLNFVQVYRIVRYRILFGKINLDKANTTRKLIIPETMRFKVVVVTVVVTVVVVDRVVVAVTVIVIDGVKTLFSSCYSYCSRNSCYGLVV